MKFPKLSNMLDFAARRRARDERYLAASTSFEDLERRMRELDRGMSSRY